MKATILIDNETQGSCACEWGFSVLIEHRDHATLLDTGASDLFVRNAEILGVDLACVDAAALSHAHYDHSDGFDAFFRANDTATLYAASGVRENCYAIEDGNASYIGVAHGLLERHASRIAYVDGPAQIAPGIWAVPHTTSGLAEKGSAAGMYVANDAACKNPDASDLAPDDFSHEQSIVVELEHGVAVFSSCSHCGADVVLAEAQRFMPGRRVRALVGGFHLYETADEDVRLLAQRLKNEGVEVIYTGHCTGERAFSILQKELGTDVVQATESGLVIKLN